MSEILVVEDEPDLRAMLGEALHGEGHTVRGAEDGDVALAEIARRRPDLVVLDLMMPNRDGFSVLRELRIDHVVPDLPVIVITAVNGMGDQSYALALGAVAYISKPFAIEPLLGTVTRALAGRKEPTWKS